MKLRDFKQIGLNNQELEKIYYLIKELVEKYNLEIYFSDSLSKTV